MTTISSNDQAVIELLRRRNTMTIDELVESLGITATAIRQRLSRLLAGELIQRSGTADGRGRPKHHYELTAKGKRSGGNNLEDLAISLWEAVQQIDDDLTKQKLMAGVVSRLAAKYGDGLNGDSVAERMQALTALFAQRQIPIEFLKGDDGQPIVKVSGCPYPDLAVDDRSICDMEKALLAQVLGSPVELCECQQDGDRCCSFEAVEGTPLTQISASQSQT